VSFEAHRTQFLPQLKKLYAESPAIKGIKENQQLMEQLRTAPEEALTTLLPDLASQLHYEVTLGTYNSVLAALPTMITQIIDTRRQADEADTKFYSQWPQLKSADKGLSTTYDKTVASAIRAVRAANPQMPMDEVITQAGIVACMTLKLPIQPPGDASAAASPVPAAAAAAPAPAAPRAVRPPGIGGSAQITPPNRSGESENIFADLTNEHMAGNI
jgi:hypothetical protein